MNAEFLYLFHSTLGTVRLRKRLAQQPHPFRVCDVPRRLSAGCGLAIRLHCPPGEWQQWCQRGETAAVFVVTKTVSIANWLAIRPLARAW